MRFIILTIVLAAAFGGCNSAPTRSIDSRASVKEGISEMPPAEARPAVEAAYSQFIDVRTAEEYSAGHAYRAVNIPLDTLAGNLDKLEKNEPVFIICRTDNRSRQAAEILKKAGFGRVVVVTGGTEAWQAAGMPMAGQPR